MRKLSLSLDELAVESFHTASASPGPTGTVRGNQISFDCGATNRATCPATCFGTCNQATCGNTCGDPTCDPSCADTDCAAACEGAGELTNTCYARPTCDPAC